MKTCIMKRRLKGLDEEGNELLRISKGDTLVIFDETAFKFEAASARDNARAGHHVWRLKQSSFGDVTVFVKALVNDQICYVFFDDIRESIVA